VIRKSRESQAIGGLVLAVLPFGLGRFTKTHSKTATILFYKIDASVLQRASDSSAYVSGYASALSLKIYDTGQT
jgi:hypothetical protein